MCCCCFDFYSFFTLFFIARKFCSLLSPSIHLSCMCTIKTEIHIYFLRYFCKTPARNRKSSCKCEYMNAKKKKEKNAHKPFYTLGIILIYFIFRFNRSVGSLAQCAEKWKILADCFVSLTALTRAVKYSHTINRSIDQHLFTKPMGWCFWFIPLHHQFV